MVHKLVRRFVRASLCALLTIFSVVNIGHVAPQLAPPTANAMSNCQVGMSWGGSLGLTTYHWARAHLDTEFYAYFKVDFGDGTSHVNVYYGQPGDDVGPPIFEMYHTYASPGVYTVYEEIGGNDIGICHSNWWHITIP